MESNVYDLKGHTDEIFSSAFNYEGDIIITGYLLKDSNNIYHVKIGSKDNTCKVWKDSVLMKDKKSWGIRFQGFLLLEISHCIPVVDLMLLIQSLVFLLNSKLVDGFICSLHLNYFFMSGFVK